MPVKKGVYDSVNGAREAAKQRKAARTAVAQAEAANSYLGDEELNAALASLTPPEAEAPPKSAKILGGRFGGLQPQRQAQPPAALLRRKSFLTAEMLENLDHATGFKPALGSGR